MWVRIGLVGCVKSKGPAPAPACELYTSPLFVGRRRLVERSCDRWFVLSALHGLVDPDEVVAPYDCSLVGPTSVGERRAWAERVLAAIDQVLGDVAGVVFEVHAGAAYRDHGLVDGLCQRGAAVEVPAVGLSQGQQLAFYKQRGGDGERSGAAIISARSAGGGSYGPLSDLLAASETARLAVRFERLEEVLGRALPASARRHRAWWANHDGPSQARAWLRVGWRVAAVDLPGTSVTFERATR